MPASSTQCPICFSNKTARIIDHFYKCRSCGIAFNTEFSPKQYDDNYFLADYRKQYGKTYIEDYDAIYAASNDRIKRILKFIKIKKHPADMSLFDVGAAAGFFLKCARDSGLGEVTGIEISKYASDYCSSTFHIPLIRSSFDDFDFTRKFDIITAWFFIEHCEYPDQVIRRIFSALNQGGVFAFSGPSIRGPLFRYKRKVWSRTHPTDHRVDFSPRFAARMLKQYGFRNVHVRPAGIHPERLVSSKSSLFKPFSFAYRIFSYLTTFSDTLEVYAVK